jgi:hypothetical protein
MKRAVMILSIMFLLTGCISQSTIKQFSHDMAVNAARNFMERSSTFAWDGVKGSLSLNNIESLDCLDCYGVTLSFECTHGGYGDRTGLIVTSAITPHTAYVIVENGKVISAILDDAWDEVNQKEIETEEPPSETPSPYDVSQCLFINFWTEKKGRIISGNVPIMMIDFPTYSYDESARRLEGLINFQITDPLIAIIGIGQNLSGDAGGGAASMLYGIYSLPYEQGTIRIERIQLNGAAELLFQGKKIILQPGEEWRKKEVRIEDVGSGRIEYTITYTIKNHGWIQKTNVRKNPF